ncbi:Cytochrome P450 [Macleaya cordata]|uniref:Cytochrome P450 n=1 Tax=Macleaya cordata TaxID=56857 RepID=A0A200R1L5_MACCD|nr:Cytochrome P450 [Macleaya cordata]
MSGSIHEIKKLKKVARQMVMDSNSHDITPKVLPHYLKWSSEFGEIFLYWFGTEPRICIADPELAKHVLSNKFGFYTKPEPRPTIIAMIGKGLALITGLDWVKHRRVVNPAFNIEKLKVMTKRMAACTASMLDGWKHQVVQSQDQSKEIEMRREFQDLTADIIAHTAFGSSYVEGKEVFEAQRELQRYAVASSNDVFIPGSQYIPTRSNIQMWKLERRVRNTVMSIIESRIDKGSGYGDDLLGLMMGVSETARKQEGPKLNMDEIIDECKTFYFAGHETTSNLLTWTVFLLSLHQGWQEMLREEVLRECGNEIPDAEMLNKLKLASPCYFFFLWFPVLETER